MLIVRDLGSGIGHKNGWHSLKSRPIRRGTVQGTIPGMGASNATFTCVRNVVVLMYFINKDRIYGIVA